MSNREDTTPTTTVSKDKAAQARDLGAQGRRRVTFRLGQMRNLPELRAHPSGKHDGLPFARHHGRAGEESVRTLRCLVDV
jgi:hypothetical protein